MSAQSVPVATIVPIDVFVPIAVVATVQVMVTIMAFMPGSVLVSVMVEVIMITAEQRQQETGKKPFQR